MLDEQYIKDEIRVRLKDYRHKFNYSIKELSEQSGVSDSTISKFENLKQDFTPSLSTLIALCNAFEITLSELFEGF